MNLNGVLPRRIFGTVCALVALLLVAACGTSAPQPEAAAKAEAPAAKAEVPQAAAPAAKAETPKYHAPTAVPLVVEALPTGHVPEARLRVG